MELQVPCPPQVNGAIVFGGVGIVTHVLVNALQTVPGQQPSAHVPHCMQEVTQLLYICPCAV